MESHASAARTGLIGLVRDTVASWVRRLYTEVDAAVTVGIAVVLAAIAFVGNGGLQLGSSTLVEIGVILIAAVLVAAALVLVGFRAVVHGGATLAVFAPSPGSRRSRSCGRCIRATPGSRPTARSPTWPPSRRASRPCGSRGRGGPLSPGACCWRWPRSASTGCHEGRARLARRGRDLRPAARALRLLERGRRDGRDGDPAVSLARHPRRGAARRASPRTRCWRS